MVSLITRSPNPAAAADLLVVDPGLRDRLGAPREPDEHLDEVQADELHGRADDDLAQADHIGVFHADREERHPLGRLILFNPPGGLLDHVFRLALWLAVGD